jgi:hypothetical protein
LTFSIANPGIGYAVNDVIRIDGGNNAAMLLVTSVFAGNRIASATILTAGNDYSSGITYGTTKTVGSPEIVSALVYVSTVDISPMLALSTIWNSAFRAIIGSTWSVSIDAPAGPVLTFSIARPGIGYAVNDVIRIDGGNNGATLLVTSVFGGNRIASATLLTAGNAYSSGITYGTTKIVGTPEMAPALVYVSTVDDGYHLFVSGATQNAAFDSAQTLTPTFDALSFAGVDMSTTLALTCAGAFGATKTAAFDSAQTLTPTFDALSFAGVDMSTTLALTCAGVSGATAGTAWTVTEALTTLLEGLGALSRVREVVHIGRVLTGDVNVQDSLDDEVHVGQAIDANVRVT